MNALRPQKVVLTHAWRWYWVLESQNVQTETLMRCAALQDVMLSLHPAWGAPIFIVAILALLYVEIQWAAFVGAAAMLLLAPLSTHLGRALGMLRVQLVGLTDTRTSCMDEIINGIRVLKFYAWELPFRRVAGCFCVCCCCYFFCRGCCAYADAAAP